MTTNKRLIDSLWCEIHTQYSEPHRDYHTLKHLEQIYKELEALTLDPIVEFTIFYHDIIYDVEKNSNEEQSALLASKRLKELKVERSLINDVTQLILLSKQHEPTDIQKYQLFLDADMTILGSSPAAYEQYTQSIRKEYSIYSDNTYNHGRRKVLLHFLKKSKLYQSEYFYHKYEEQAQKNILTEYHQIRV